MSVWPENNLPVVLVGPTASGKTAAAIALAERIHGEIVNADSMQIYIGMDIGTAKATPEEQARVPFHLLDLVTPDTPFSVADWKKRAEIAIAEITARNCRAIVCGGTGLYVRALLDDWTLAETPRDETLRQELQLEADNLGANVLHARLAERDPEAAARLHPNDAVRIIRALEVLAVTGQTISAYQAQDKATRQPRRAFRFGLDLPRPNLYERIEYRVNAMIAAGLETEVRGLLAKGYAPTLGPLRSLGYKEMIAHLQGETTIEEAIKQIKLNTRRYAKRQQTWFRADPLLKWLNVESLSAADIASQIEAELATSNASPHI